MCRVLLADNDTLTMEIDGDKSDFIFLRRGYGTQGTGSDSEAILLTQEVRM